jgi:glycosyltransferase involved in cell wall biosynthesis
VVKVSVIVPVYKVPLDYLRECLDSLAAQTMQECEFIVVSDGAPEAECSVCEEYVTKDSRFKFFKQVHTGVSATRNYGIYQSQGEYISFVDADDWLERDALKMLYQNAVDWDSDIINTNYIIYRNNVPQHIFWSSSSKRRLNEDDIKSILNEFISLKDNSIPRGVCGKLYKRIFLNEIKVRFNENIKIQEDTLFNQVCFLKAKKISYLNKLFYHYRDNLGSATRKFRKDYLDIVVQAMLEIEKNSTPQQKTLIGKQIVQRFFESWDCCYMSHKNTDYLWTRMRILSNMIRSKDFQHLISDVDSRSMPILVRFELFLFKKKITFPIWLHGLKKIII